MDACERMTVSDVTVAGCVRGCDNCSLLIHVRMQDERRAQAEFSAERRARMQRQHPGVTQDAFMNTYASLLSTRTNFPVRSHTSLY